MKTILLSAALATLPMLAAPAFAADEANVTPGLSTAGAPLGLRGADPVALLMSERTIAGDAALAAVHNGVAYYFASQANKAAFEANPAKFEIQNGGYCSLGVAVGKKLDGDPKHFTIHDGELYVFLNAATRETWLKDLDANRAKAETTWPKIKHVAATDL